MHQVLLLCFFILLVFFTFSFRRIKKVDKHDQVLFPFCQLRRDIMRHLLDNLDTLTPEEYRPLRKLLTMLDNTIHNYNQHKTFLFNYRKIPGHIKKHQVARKKMEKNAPGSNPDTRKFYQRFIQCLAKAILAYTPLLRSELILRIVALAFLTGLRSGKEQEILDGARQVRYDAQNGYAYAH